MRVGAFLIRIDNLFERKWGNTGVIRCKIQRPRSIVQLPRRCIVAAGCADTSPRTRTRSSTCPRPRPSAPSGARPSSCPSSHIALLLHVTLVRLILGSRRRVVLVRDETNLLAASADTRKRMLKLEKTAQSSEVPPRSSVRLLHRLNSQAKPPASAGRQ